MHSWRSHKQQALMYESLLFNRDYQALNQKGAERLRKTCLVRWHLYLLFLSSVLPHLSSRFISHLGAHLGASNNVNKTDTQILRHLPCQPPHCLHITHLNNAWWETGSGGASNYTVFIPNEKAWPYSVSPLCLFLHTDSLIFLSNSVLSYWPHPLFILSSDIFPPSFYLLLHFHPCIPYRRCSHYCRSDMSHHIAASCGTIAYGLV